MSQYPAKFRLIFLPVLAVAIATIGLYTFLNWLLIIRFHVILIDEDVINLFIPGIVPWIPLLIWIRPRLKLLKLDYSGRKNPLGGLLMLLWIIIGLPLIIAQWYLITATGKLTQLKTMSQIVEKPPTRYYKVEKFYADKTWRRIRTTFEVSGKGNRDYTISIHLAVPVFDNPPVLDTSSKRSADSSSARRPLLVIDGESRSFDYFKKLDPKDIENITVLKNAAATSIYGSRAEMGAVLITTKGLNNDRQTIDPPPAIKWPATWMAFVYHETISNNRSVEDKEAEYKRFFQESMADFNAINLAGVSYMDRLGYNFKQREGIATVNSKRYEKIAGPVIILSPVFESYQDRNGHKLAWSVGSLIAGLAIFLLLLKFIALL